MDHIADIEEAKSSARARAERLLRDLRTHADGNTPSLDVALDRLRAIRKDLYEDLNQIQHECLILRALAWLEAHGYDRHDWFWNPRQTGDATEPDLAAKAGKKTVVSAEVTTSESPDGIIDSRMRDTLAKLARMSGRRFYFVRTAQMARRARTKAAKNAWDIQVVDLDDDGQP